MLRGLWKALFGSPEPEAPVPEEPLRRLTWDELPLPGQQPPAATRPRWHEEIEEDDDDGWWGRWKPKESSRTKDWTIVRRVAVAGTGYRRARCLAFIVAFKDADRLGVPYGVEIEREPTNPADANALAVYGTLGPERHHLGYVPRAVAELIAEFPPDMPLGAELTEISTFELAPEERVEMDTSFGIFINVLRPAKRSEWWKTHMKGAE